MNDMRADMNGVDPLANNLTHRAVIGDILTRGRQMYGDRIAIIDEDQEISYQTLDMFANAIARGLEKANLRRGHAVAVMLNNRWEYIAAFFGCAKLGVIVLPINTALAPREVSYQLVDSRVEAIITESCYLKILGESLQLNVEHSVGHIYTVDQNYEDIAGIPILQWKELLKHPNDTFETIVEDRDIVQCLYTSGTTSAPKGVLTSHVAVQIAVMNSAIHLGLRPSRQGAIMPIVLPLFHVAGLNLLSMPMLLTGGTIILHRKFESSVILDDISKRRATHFMGHATMWRAFLDDPKLSKIDTSCFRLGIYAMAQIPPEMLGKLRKYFSQADIVLVSGQTEVTPINEMQWSEHQGLKDNSWGMASVTTDVRIMGSGGQLLPRGQIGEIVYRSPQLMEGYWNRADANNETFAHGWFHGGDVGYMDDEGVIWFVDRTKDMVKTGGENVSSVEVERVIVGFDGIAECAVIGVPDDRWGEAVTAFIILKKDMNVEIDELRSYCKRHLATFKVPKVFKVVEDLPRTATGKVTKHLLRGISHEKR